MSKNWLSAHLYYAPPWEEFLVEGVRPFVDEMWTADLIDQFFFIRYGYRGPHIRLRLRGDKAVLNDQVAPRLRAYFENYFEKRPSVRDDPDWVSELPPEQAWLPNNSIQFVPYEPEVTRYGGPEGIHIAERQFQLSTQIVLARLAGTSTWNYEMALGTAVQLHLAFAHALGMDLIEVSHFYTFISQRWFGRAYQMTAEATQSDIEQKQQETLSAFAQSFAQQKDSLVHIHQVLWSAFQSKVEFEQNWLNEWLIGMKTIGQQLEKAQIAGKITAPAWFTFDPELMIPQSRQALWPIWDSYVHMTNNRLGILNQDEAYLGYLLQRSIEGDQRSLVKG